MFDKVKQICIVVVLLFVVTIQTQAVELPAPGAPVKPVDGIAAVVNDEVILQSELKKAVEEAKQQAQATHTILPDDSKIRQQLLKKLTYQKIQLQMIKKTGISITNAELTTAIEHIAKQQKLSLQQLKSQLAQQGISYPDFESKIRNQLLISKLQHQAIAQDIDVSSQDIAKARKALEAHQASAVQYQIIDIRIPLAEKATQAQRVQAEKILKTIQQQLKSGVSTDTLQGAEVVDLGWRTQSQLPDIFVQQLVTMKPGQISDQISASNGLHLLQLIQKKGDSSSLTDQQIRDFAYDQQYNKALSAWLKTIYQQSYIQIVNSQ